MMILLTMIGFTTAGTILRRPPLDKSRRVRSNSCSETPGRVP